MPWLCPTGKKKQHRNHNYADRRPLKTAESAVIKYAEHYYSCKPNYTICSDNRTLSSKEAVLFCTGTKARQAADGQARQSSCQAGAGEAGGCVGRLDRSKYSVSYIRPGNLDLSHMYPIFCK